MAADGTSRSRGRQSRRDVVEETSAGGMVLDLAQEPVAIALIGRIDRRGNLAWSLPKGHVEPGERDDQAAVREVREETGIQGEVLAPLGTIDFWFMAEGRRIHKTVHHFLMRATGGALSTDDPEVTETRWATFEESSGLLAYADERDLIAKARIWLTEHPTDQR